MTMEVLHRLFTWKITIMTYPIGGKTSPKGGTIKIQIIQWRICSEVILSTTIVLLPLFRGELVFLSLGANLLKLVVCPNEGGCLPIYIDHVCDLLVQQGRLLDHTGSTYPRGTQKIHLIFGFFYLCLTLYQVTNLYKRICWVFSCLGFPI